MWIFFKIIIIYVLINKDTDQNKVYAAHDVQRKEVCYGQDKCRTLTVNETRLDSYKAKIDILYYIMTDLYIKK